MVDTELGSGFLDRLGALYRIRRPGLKTAGEYELYLVDLSDWKLRFSDPTPLIWVRSEAGERLPAVELVESLRDVAREQGWQHRQCIILLDAGGADLKDQASTQHFPRFVVVDAEDQRHILAARSFTGSLLDLVCEQVPISILAPYQTSAPVTGSAFFGREREIARILAQAETSVAITGVRRIGKTSLLRELYKRLLDQGERPARCVWLDASTLSTPYHFVQEVVRHLRTKELRRLQHPERFWFFFPDFLKRMYKRHGGRITIFLDEADDFLMWAREDPEMLAAMRASMNAGHCRCILAGFEILQAELFDQESPLFMRFERLSLGPFEKREVEEVMVKPMRSLRLRLENVNELVGQVYTDTRGHPLLVQYYCRELVQSLESRGTRTLGPTSLSGIYTSNGFRAQIINSFRDNLQNPEKLLVYALLLSFPAGKEEFGQDEMYGALRKQGCPYSAREVDQACERLVQAGVLSRDGPRYEFASAVFPRMLVADFNLNYLLSVAKKEMNL
jgi:Cdc6-like AAA superfamily ATPase